MTAYILLGLVLAAVAAACWNWRYGMYALMAVALLVDPLRKMAPGAPSYMMLAVTPVWLCVLGRAWRDGDLRAAGIRTFFPVLWRLGMLYVFVLLVPGVLSLTYAPGSWRYTLIGAYMQGCLLGGIVLGFAFARRRGDIGRLVKWYAVLAAAMMTGVLLERWNVTGPPGLIGTSALGTYWVTYRTGAALRMLSGFFRSPDVQGWHAAALAMLGVTLALKSTRWGRVGWAVLAGWGGVALMFCARRKMIAMVPVFGVALFAVYILQGQARRLVRVLLAAGIMAGVGTYVYLSVGANEEVEKFYGTTVGEVDARVQQHGIVAVIDTLRQAGWTGYGLGMAVPSVHNIGTERPRIWQESGPSMIAAEMGIPGLAAFGLLLVGLLAAGFRAVQRAAPTSEQPLFVGIASLVLANVAGGVVSAQVFGDPFIGCILPFLTGVVLSGTRLERAETKPPAGSGERRA